MEYKEREEKITRVVGAVIFNQGRDTILVGQRAETAKYPLKWEFIGGKVIPGESLSSAIERELLEEINLRVAAGKLLGVARYDYGGEIGVIQVNFIECQPKGSVVVKPDPDAYAQIKWVPIARLPQLDWIEANKEFARKLAVDLTSPKPSQN
jgi:8-oxo-dGTP diphosphatase